MPHITTNDGVKLQYELHGTSGPVVVCIHGWSASSKYFTDQLAAVSASCRVLAYDQRGHGGSDHTDHGLHIARLAMDLSNLLTQLELEDVTLVGTSLGCAVIWSYIELFASRGLRQAVFVDQAPLQNRKPDWQLGSLGCYDAATLAGLQAALLKDMSAFADGNLEGCTCLPIRPELAAALKAETLRCSPQHLGELMADHTQLDWRPLCRRITLPCLNVIGCKSGIFPVAGCEAVSELIPDCKTAYFKEANHWLYLEEADKFNELLLRFVLGKGVAEKEYL